MKLTNKQLKQIIKEELNAILVEEAMGAVVPKGMPDALQHAHHEGLFHKMNNQSAERQLSGILRDSLDIDAKMSGTIAQILMFQGLAKGVIDGKISDMDLKRMSRRAQKAGEKDGILIRLFNEELVAFVIRNVIPVLRGLKNTAKAPAQAPTVAPPPTSGVASDFVFE